MSDIQALGNNVLVTAQAGFLIWVNAVGAAESAKEVATVGGTGLLASLPAGVEKALEMAAPFVTTILGAMMVFGTINAYVLPMVTYLLWLFAVMGCACYAAEVVIAAPLAAFMHIRMDGAELINQEQRTIYSIVLGGFLRPTLLLLGLIMSSKIFAVMAGYVNATFAIAMLASQGNSIIGLFGILAMLAILMYLHYQLAVRSFSLVHEVPRMVSHIIGVQDSERGEQEHSTKVFGAVGNFVNSTGSRGVSMAASGAVKGGAPRPLGPAGNGGGNGGSIRKSPVAASPNPTTHGSGGNGGGTAPQAKPVRKDTPSGG